MFARIVLPLDGSEFAEQALPPAEYLAKMSGATLHLVRVVEPPFEAMGSAHRSTSTQT